MREQNQMDTAMVLDLRTSRTITSSILYSQVPVVAVGLFADSEGVPSLVAVKHWDSNRVWLYDLKIYPSLMFEGDLARLLSTPEVRKVVHNARTTSRQLERIFNVKMRNTFDMQLAFDLLREEQNMPKRQASIEELESYLEPGKNFSQLCPNDVSETNIPDFWRRRPLSKALQTLAGRLVFSLVPNLYQAIIRELSPDTVYLLDNFTDDNIYQVLSQNKSERQNQQQYRRW